METTQKYFYTALSWLFIYFAPAGGFILLVGFFVIADTVTGVLAAPYRNQLRTSKKFRVAFPKYIVYGVAVLVAHVIQQQFFPDFPAVKLISGFIAYSELISIDENIKDITGVSLFSYFIKKLKK